MRTAHVNQRGSWEQDPCFQLGYGSTLSTLRQWLLAGMLSIFCLTGTNAMAGKSTLESEGPPSNYRLDQVSFLLTNEYGHGFPLQRVSLAGTGHSTIERDGKKFSFHYPTTDLLLLLNELYKIRFFNLPTNYTTRYSIFLKDDGTVGSSALRMQDASSTTLCFTVVDYEKCVRFSDQGPSELKDLAKRIFSEADQLVK